MTYEKAHKLLLYLEATGKGTKDIAGETTVHQVRPNRSRRNPQKETRETKPSRSDPFPTEVVHMTLLAAGSKMLSVTIVTNAGT